ncbi:hypothetical protein MRX96_037334 [Rhipicephalus microplus]
MREKEDDRVRSDDDHVGCFFALDDNTQRALSAGNRFISICDRFSAIGSQGRVHTLARLLQSTRRPPYARAVFVTRFVLIFPHLLAFRLVFFFVFCNPVSLFSSQVASEATAAVLVARPATSVHTAGECKFVLACVWHGRP